MKKQAVLILALIISIGIFAQKPKKFNKEGIKLFETNQYNEAIDQFNQAIQLDATYVDAYVWRAKAYEKINKLELAAKDYEKAVELKPKVVNYIFEAGKLNYKIDNYDKALKYLTEAVVLDNKHFQAFQFKSFTHIKLGKYKDAIATINNAILIKETYVGHYVSGVANDSLTNYPQAINEYNKAIGLNPNFERAFYALSKAFVKNNELDKAIENANRSVQKFPESAEAFETRSFVFYSMGELANAINDLTKLETLADDPKLVLFTRGLYYFEYKQYQNAKSDFSQLIALSQNNYDAIYWRGRANEAMTENDEAAKDYIALIALMKKDNIASANLNDANKRLYEINREKIAPIVVIDTPMVIQQTKLAVLDNAKRITIKGKISDDSEIESITINNKKIEILDNKTFSHSINIVDISLISFTVNDVYNNETKVEYDLVYMEVDAPVVKITTPYAGDNNEMYLDSEDSKLFIEGFIEDESTIKDIFINNIRATFNDADLNPRFTLTVDIENKNTIIFMVIDVFGNTTETTFTLNRDGAVIAANNPMGKTWVVFIENSNYETFAGLEGPTKDVSSIKGALSNYEIHNFIHKKDMSKKDMERFFSIELRDLVKKNNVNSLLVWYAGHGKYINETGYWIPVDATRDDEFTYFNINSLKAGMQSYSGYITHTLIITDACESGPSFYQAMRSTNEIRSCDDINATKFKSAQIFSSAGNELASDNSQFTKTFAKSLQYNENSCIPIEAIVIQVTKAVANNKDQKPIFGKIAGFEDENGTFFFIKK